MNIYTKTIPIFPLSGAILLPSGNLPLNIFEPRYVSLVNYALKHNKLIGMIQPKCNDSKELFKIGCLGQITTFNETEDNKYIISLKGLLKFQIKNEIKNNRKFRIFDVEYEETKANFNQLNNKLFNKNKFLEKINIFFKKKGLVLNFKSLIQINNESLIIMIAMICPFSNNEKQMLLECKNINYLANTIISLLDFEINQENGNETIN